MRNLRICCMVAMAAAGMMASGCITGPSGMAQSHDGSLLSDLKNDPLQPRLTRLQRSEPSDPKTPPPEFKGPPDFKGPPAGSTTTPQGPPTNASLPPAMPMSFKINVRAYVNGKPLFEDEIFQGLTREQYTEISRLTEAERNEKFKGYFNKQREAIIDQELMYQDAVHKLEKGNPKALDKLKSLARHEYDKHLKRIRDSKQVSEQEIRGFSKMLLRKTEREFIAMEYMRSRVFPRLNTIIGPPEVYDYYVKHINEFQKVETVQWQDVFLAVGPKYPTVAQARRYAEDLVARCRTVEDFEKLLALDDGDSKARNGEGFGKRRGEIRPAEVEAHLFNLRDGEIGPVIELSTGVHIFRLVKRDPGGVVPFNETVQLQIRNKLRNEVADREIKRLIRELRTRAVIERVDPET